MAAYYFDSSGLVKRYAREIGTIWVSEITNPLAGHEPFTSLITGAETVAAIAKRQHTGSISAADAGHALSAFKGHFQSQYLVTAVTRGIVDRAMALAERYALRGYDAVQPATALELEAERLAVRLSPVTFVSADDDLNAAATQEGLAVDNPNTHSRPDDLTP